MSRKSFERRYLRLDRRASRTARGADVPPGCHAAPYHALALSSPLPMLHAPHSVRRSPSLFPPPSTPAPRDPPPAPPPDAWPGLPRTRRTGSNRASARATARPPAGSSAAPVPRPRAAAPPARSPPGGTAPRTDTPAARTPTAPCTAAPRTSPSAQGTASPADGQDRATRPPGSSPVPRRHTSSPALPPRRPSPAPSATSQTA